MNFDEISDEEWLLLAPVLADPPIVHRPRGRPRASVRVVANAVLWVLTTGDSWSMLPNHYPSAPTCRHRFEAWRSSGALAQMYQILSSSGRKLRCGPQLTLQRRDALTRGIDRQTRDVGCRRVFWRDQASWQAPRETWQSPQPADTFKAIALELPNPANSAYALPERVEARAPVTPRHSVHRVASPWMGLASKGHTESDPRGYVIYIAADRLANARFRGWAEIVRDGRRVARSGLIGPSFKNCETARQYALEWARRWIGEESVEDDGGAELDSGVRQQKTRSG